MNPLQSTPQQASSPLGTGVQPQGPMPPQQSAPPPSPQQDPHTQIGSALAAANIDPVERAKMIEDAVYASSEFARLAKDPDIKAKDVIKAAADAVAAKKVEPSRAIALLSAMPSDPQKLHSWVKQQALVYMTGVVHLKAQQIKMDQPTPGSGVPN